MINIRVIGVSSEHKEYRGKYYTYLSCYAKPFGSFRVAVDDTSGLYKRDKYVTSDPVWNSIANERTTELQQFVEENIDTINDAYIAYIKEVYWRR